MLSFFPTWVSDALLILTFLAGPTGVIWGILQRKDANRKLVVEEGSLEIDQFQVQRQAFNDLLREQREINSGAAATLASVRAELVESRQQLASVRAELVESGEQRAHLSEDVKDLRNALDKVRNLFEQVISQNGVVLTEEEAFVFETTRPRPPRYQARRA